MSIVHKSENLFRSMNARAKKIYRIADFKEFAHLSEEQRNQVKEIDIQFKWYGFGNLGL